MTDERRPIEDRLHALAGSREESSGQRSGRKAPLFLADASTRKKHAGLLASAAQSWIDAVNEDDAAIVSENDVAGYRQLAKTCMMAVGAILDAAEVSVENARFLAKNLRIENAKLSRKNGDRVRQVRDRKQAEVLVASGAVQIVGAGDHFVFAKATVDGRELEVRRRANVWRCECGAEADCVHIGAARLISEKSSSRTPTSRDAASFASAGCVTVKLHELNLGRVEVVDGDLTHSVVRDGVAGGTCTCGAPNATCVHGDVAKLVTQRFW